MNNLKHMLCDDCFTWIFQPDKTTDFCWLADDGHFYVNLRYPVAAPFLMDIENNDPRTNTNPEAIAIKEWGSDYEQERKSIDAYNQEALHHFNNSESITPSLSLLDALVGSLKIEIPLSEHK